MLQKENRDSALVVFAIVLILVSTLVGVVVGLALGWLVFPVEWVDSPPSALADVYREDYLRMAIDSYMLNANCALAVRRYETLGETGRETLTLIKSDTGNQSPESITAFSECVEE
jgi:hypothetical protein